MFNIQLIEIPAGNFLMGSTRDQVKELHQRFPDIDIRLLEREIPQHVVWLDKYFISKNLVTNEDFSRFTKETSYLTTAEKKGTGYVFSPKFNVVKKADWRHPFGPESNIDNKKNHPVVQVSWYDAIAYCNWLSKKTHKNYRLPTEAEWEKAARGKAGRIFPWGNKWNPKICNAKNWFGDTTPVEKFSPYADSPYGCTDMAGNVFQWTSTTIGVTGPWPAKYDYPYQSNDGREELILNTRRVGRGGSYSREEVYCRSAFRFADPPEDRYSAQGFRVVMSA